MPAVSKDQRKAMAIAEHNPQKLYKKNRGLLRMTHKQLHELAALAKGDLEPAHERRT